MPEGLKPCPFCGSDRISHVQYYEFDEIVNYVLCMECRARTRTLRRTNGSEGLNQAFKQKAAEYWNRRTDPLIAEWLPSPYDMKRGLCSNCGEWSDGKPKYCPHCGAFMISGHR